MAWKWCSFKSLSWDTRRLIFKICWSLPLIYYRHFNFLSWGSKSIQIFHFVLNSPIYFQGFFCILCTSSAPQRPAHGSVSSQVATHLRTAIVCRVLGRSWIWSQDYWFAARCATIEPPLLLPLSHLSSLFCTYFEAAQNAFKFALFASWMLQELLYLRPEQRLRRQLSSICVQNLYRATPATFRTQIDQWL
jgi:hypothetical protein